MRIRLPYLVLLLLLAFVAGTAATPAALDPVRVAPHIYELVFENDRVRVLKKTIRAGETPPLHSHPDRVIVYLNPCAWMQDDADGSQHMESFKFGTPVWAPAESHGGITSTVVQQCSVIEVELK
jgi:beta-alanine degradation protein BauB